VFTVLYGISFQIQFKVTVVFQFDFVLYIKNIIIYIRYIANKITIFCMKIEFLPIKDVTE